MGLEADADNKKDVLRSTSFFLNCRNGRLFDGTCSGPFAAALNQLNHAFAFEGFLIVPEELIEDSALAVIEGNGQGFVKAFASFKGGFTSCQDIEIDSRSYDQSGIELIIGLEGFHPFGDGVILIADGYIKDVRSGCMAGAILGAPVDAAHFFELEPLGV